MVVENQNLADADEYKALMDSLEDETDLEENIPDDDDKQSKIGHAFAEKKRVNKEAASLIKKQQDEIEKYKNASKEAPTSAVTGQPNETGVNSGPQMKNILDGLTLQAMQRLGIFQITTPSQQEMVRMERDRLYAKQANNYEVQEAAKQNAPRIIDTELSVFSQLNEEDVKAIKVKLNTYDVLQRVDSSVIRKEVALYLGEQRLSTPSEEEEEENLEPNNTELSAEQKAAGVTSSLSAASSVKSGQVHKGVKPGKQAKSGPAPAKPEELAMMQKLGMNDLAAFRDAQALKAKYKT